MSAIGARVPDLILEQYALGELSAEQKAELDSALASDASLRLRLAELRASDEAILEAAPPAKMAAAVRRRMLAAAPSPRAKDRVAFRPASFLLFPAAAAVLVLVGAAMALGLLFPGAGDATRPKGGATGLSIYKKDGSGTRELRDGQAAKAGEVLQLRYGAGGVAYGAIFSLDGRGTLTRHLPADGARDALSPRLEAGGASLPAAYELDDAPLFERFFLLSSNRAFDLAAAAAALRDLAAAADPAKAAPFLPAGVEWRSLILMKEGGRP